MELSFRDFLVLVDGIYPPYSRFVKGLKLPLTDVEKRYTAWQESGGSKERYTRTCVWRPSKSVPGDGTPFAGSFIEKAQHGCFCVLDNASSMCVSDRIMDRDVYVRYNPAEHYMDEEESQDAVIEYENGEDNVMHAAVGLGNQGNLNVVENMLARQNHWREVDDRAEHARLYMALRDVKGYGSLG